MRNYRNNLRKNKYRNGSDRGFSRNNSTKKIHVDFANVENFKRKNPGRNNQNAPKLIDKYTELAREALSKGDKILSENYYQHAEHFTRILSEKNNSVLRSNQDNSEKVEKDSIDSSNQVEQK